VFPVKYEHHLYIKSKAIPVICHRDLQACETSRIPRCVNSRFTYGGKVASLTHRLRSTLQKPLSLLSLILISVTG
jgi:hypothetical protein